MSASVQSWSAPAGQGLRNDAVALLTDKAKAKLDGQPSAQLYELLSTVNSRMQECEQLHWMIKGVLLRDVFLNVAKRVEKSVDLGEVVAHNDPGHAELPCATLRFLFKVRKRHLLTAFKVVFQDSKW